MSNQVTKIEGESYNITPHVDDETLLLEEEIQEEIVNVKAELESIILNLKIIKEESEKVMLGLESYDENKAS